MIFINCIKESLAQVGDKTRIDVSTSFVSGSSITNISIRPSATDSFISVFSTKQDNWFLDWAYMTEGEKTITVEATDGTDTVSREFVINAISQSEDNLYSSDEQLFTIESEIRRYLPPGRNSFKNVHREAQSRILNYLDRKRIWNSDGTALTKEQINLTGEVSKWSVYESLFIIYTDLFIAVGDKFAEKVNQYKELRNIERERGSLRIDRDRSGEIQHSGETTDLKSFRMVRR
jgi:hypothetical protein